MGCLVSPKRLKHEINTAEFVARFVGYLETFYSTNRILAQHEMRRGLCTVK
jgi:hypothetical protein